MTPDELANRLDPLAWRIAIGMELHAACSSTTKAKTVSVLDDLVNSMELAAIILAAEVRGMERAAEICAGIRQRITNGPMPEGARFDYEQAIRAAAKERQP